MKQLIILLAVIALCACGDSGSDTDSANESTELRDWAQSHTSRAELTAELAEAKMTLRLVTQTDPEGEEARQLKARIESIEQKLEALKDSARQ